MILHHGSGPVILPPWGSGSLYSDTVTSTPWFGGFKHGAIRTIRGVDLVVSSRLRTFCKFGRCWKHRCFTYTFRPKGKAPMKLLRHARCHMLLGVLQCATSLCRPLQNDNAAGVYQIHSIHSLLPSISHRGIFHHKPSILRVRSIYGTTQMFVGNL